MEMKVLEEKILNILGKVNEDILSYTGENMIGDGIIDSFELIEIVNRLEEELDIEIDGEYVVVQNFANKDAVIALIKNIMK